MKTSLIVSVLSILVAQVSFAQEATTTGSVSTQAPAAALPIALSVKTELSNANLEKAKNVGGGLSENQFRLSYKFNNQIQAGILVANKYNWATETEAQADQKAINSDAAIVGLWTTADVLGADKLDLDGRIYLPTSQFSQDVKQNYLLRLDATMPYTLAPQSKAILYISPRFADLEVADSKFELVSQAKLSQGKVFAPYIALNHKLKMINSIGMTRTDEVMGPEAGIEVTATSNIKVYAYLAQDRNVFKPTAKKAPARYTAFETTETKYLLGAQIKL